MLKPIAIFILKPETRHLKPLMKAVTTHSSLQAGS
jgi:hypothetical protein